MDADKLPTDQPTMNDADAASESTRRLRASLGWIERRIGIGGDGLWRALKTRPFLGVAAATTLGFGLAVTLGASELIVGVAAGYAAYLILQKGEPPTKAIEKAAKLGL
jgi:hypothetical protein